MTACDGTFDRPQVLDSVDWISGEPEFRELEPDSALASGTAGTEVCRLTIPN